MGRGHALTQCLRHATVEPWPGNQVELPKEVTLVGPTATHWAQSRGRLHGMQEHDESDSPSECSHLQYEFPEFIDCIGALFQVEAARK